MKKKPDKVGKKQVFVISLDPFSQECVVVINGHINDAVKFLKKQTTQNAKDTVLAIEKEYKIYSGKPTRGGALLWHKLPYGYIMMIEHVGWVPTVGNVVHECSHLVHFVLDRAGLTWSEESDETYSYLIEKAVEDILEKIY